MRFPYLFITEEMIVRANELIPQTKVNRTVTSGADTLTGHLGEFIFAQYFRGDWRKNNVGKNKGKADFDDIEVKTSAFPFSTKLHLLVREDYALKRKPRFYVQLIIDIARSPNPVIVPGNRVYLCGYATTHEVDSAPLKDFGSKFGGKGGYLCRYIPITQLHPISALRRALSVTGKQP